jgi:hypothetical protein
MHHLFVGGQIRSWTAITGGQELGAPICKLDSSFFVCLGGGLTVFPDGSEETEAEAVWP